jgi:hypothetical protein
LAQAIGEQTGVITGDSETHAMKMAAATVSIAAVQEATFSTLYLFDALDPTTYRINQRNQLRLGLVVASPKPYQQLGDLALLRRWRWAHVHRKSLLPKS